MYSIVRSVLNTINAIKALLLFTLDCYELFIVSIKPNDRHVTVATTNLFHNDITSHFSPEKGPTFYQ